MSSGENETWRMFCAIELPNAVRSRLLEHVAQLKLAWPGAPVSWARDTSLHLTLKFLGNIPTDSVSKISQAASSAAAAVEPFSIRLETPGVFPERGPARVLWIGVKDNSGKLSELQRKLEEQAALVGFEKELRGFSPHLTIARPRNPQQARTFASVHMRMGFEPVDMEVSELLAIRSELSSAGSKHTVISRHQLGN